MKDQFYGLKVTRTPNGSEPEKVSVNMNPATLSSIDLLVDNGYYSNRSDFINQAVREALSRQQTVIDRIADQNIASSAANGNHWFLGIYCLTAADVARTFESGAAFSLRGYGVLKIDPDCSEEKLFASVTDIQMRGKVIAPETVKKHYGLK